MRPAARSKSHVMADPRKSLEGRERQTAILRVSATVDNGGVRSRLQASLNSAASTGGKNGGK